MTKIPASGPAGAGALAPDRVRALAPAKAILFGEHYVVYGAPGIVGAIEPYNRLHLEAKAVRTGEPPRLAYRTALGTLQLRGAADGRSVEDVKGPSELRPQVAVYARLLRAQPKLRTLAVNAELEAVWPLKGVGNSASLGALMGAGLRALSGTCATPEQLAEDANAADNIAHGETPSGIDASAVAHGGALIFQKEFKKDGTAEGKAKALKMRIPAGWSFLVIDTLGADERPATTANQIEAFASARNIRKKPGALTESERRHIVEPYMDIYEKACSALKSGGMRELGNGMNECQALLAAGGVSSPRIDEAVRLSLDAGAAGAKLSGAGGAGGMALALLKKEDEEKARRVLKREDYRAFEFSIARKGAHAGKT